MRYAIDYRFKLNKQIYIYTHNLHIINNVIYNQYNKQTITLKFKLVNTKIIHTQAMKSISKFLGLL